MVVLLGFLLLMGVASVAFAVKPPRFPRRHHALSSRVIPNVIAVRVSPSISCAETVGAALKAAGCQVIPRTNVQTNLASMCSFEIMNTCSYTSAVSQSNGFLQSYSVTTMDRPEPKEISPATTTRALDATIDAIHKITGVLDARNKLGLTGKGIKVAIIDTGVYYLHPALGGGFGPGFKVAFGYDLVGDNYNGTSASIQEDNDPLDNCGSNAHGTHVAGIVGANATSISTPGFVPDFPFTGVAPGVTLGAYRVFSCSYPSADSDITAAAVLRAAADGADIINLSLGVAGGYSDAEDAVAAEIVAKSGVVVVASIGNDGRSGAYYSGNPGNSLRGLGIASLNNVNIPSLQLKVNGVSYPYSLGVNNGKFKFNVPYSGSFVVNDPNAAADHVLDDGCDFLNVNVRGKAVVLYWGEPNACSSETRCDVAAAAGAAACIMYLENDDFGSASSVAGSKLIPSLITTFSAGQAILASLAANKNPSVVPTKSFAEFPSLTGGTLSSFSSSGLTNELFLKPDLGGIGGKVYSTLSPFAAAFQNLPSPYAVYSGTSMSSPYVAGCIALLLQKRGKIGFDAARAYLQNTATVTKIYNTSLVHSPAYQGAGLVNIYKAATTQTLVRPSALSLNDTANRKRFETIQIKNNYKTTVTYRLSHTTAATVKTFNSGDGFVLDQSTTTFTKSKAATLKFLNSTSSKLSITIKSGKSATIRLEIIPPTSSSSFPFPLFGGYITISNSVDSIVTRVPYAGVGGVWKNREIWARNSTSLYNRWALGSPNGPLQLFFRLPASTATGLYADARFTPLTALQIVNASDGAAILAPLTSASRSINVTITYLCNNDAPLQALGLKRTNLIVTVDLSTFLSSSTRETRLIFFQGTTRRDLYSTPHVFGFYGHVLGPTVANRVVELPAGVYQMKFTAWRNFGNENDVDVITTPPFQLIYKSALSSAQLANCQV